MVRSLLVILATAACASEGLEPVPCDGVLDPGELCDDGNTEEHDGCDCGARLIPPAPAVVEPGVPVVIAENGAWCWFQDERAIVDGPALVVASIGHGGDIQVGSYRPDTGARTETILHRALERDDHDVPSLLPLADGRIAAFYTRHDGFPRLYTRVSARAGDPTAWGPLQVTSFLYDVTYTNPFQLAERPGDTLLFLRGIALDPTLVVSRDLGGHWTDGAQLLESGVAVPPWDHRPYVKYASDGTRAVHLFYTDGHPDEFGRNSIYHLVHRDRALWRSDGTRVASADNGDQPAVAPEAGTSIYDGEGAGGQAWTWDATLTDGGDPVVVFSTFPDPARSYFDHRYRYARWHDGARHVHAVAHAGTGIYRVQGFYSGGISLDPDDPDVVYFASNVEPTTGEATASGLFELYRGVTTDRGATWEISAVTAGSTADNLRPIVPAHHAAPTTLLWMRGSYDTYLDYRTQIVALTGDAGAIAAVEPPAEVGLRALARFDLAATEHGPATPTAPGFVAAVPADGVATATDGGITLVVSHLTGTRDLELGDPLYRGYVYTERGGLDPGDKLRVVLGGLTAGQAYVVRLHGHDDDAAYLRPTLWFRGDATSLAADRGAAYLGGHRNVSGTFRGEGATELVLTADAAGRIALVGRGLDDLGDDTRAILAGVEVLERPAFTPLARFDVDATGGRHAAPGAAAVWFNDLRDWSGEATDGGITLRVTSDRIRAIERRVTDDPWLADFVFGRDQLVIDLAGLEPGRLYAITIHAADVESNGYATARWQLDEPGRAPLVVRGFHMNLHGAGASFTIHHRAAATTLRLRGGDVMSSLSTEPSVVLWNGLELAVAP